jgi:hypothetical protein
MTSHDEALIIQWREHQTGGGSAMTFEDLLDQAIAMLQRRGRVTYRTLKLQFQLDDEQLEALKEALIEAERLAVDEAGESPRLGRSSKRILGLKGCVSA